MVDLFKKHKKGIKVISIFFIVLMTILYLRLFFQEGIVYDRTFLVKKESSQEKSFEGENRWGRIKIDVKGDYSKDNEFYINYKLPNEINRAYRAEFNLDQTNDLYKLIF